MLLLYFRWNYFLCDAAVLTQQAFRQLLQERSLFRLGQQAVQTCFRDGIRFLAEHTRGSVSNSLKEANAFKDIIKLPKLVAFF